EVLAWNGLNITGSQPCKLSTEHSFVIHLQLKSGYIDIIPVTQGQTDFDFVLSRPPVEALVTEGEVKTVYSLSTDDRQDDDLFLITTKRRAGIFENELTLVNLDERYYQNDSDIKNNLI
ncbi:host specificity factor TipJ family phage tail protein, partial [Acinetobacter baumannii]